MNITNEPTCHIVDCLNDAMEFLNLSYDAVESMAFKEGIYPQGYKVYFDATDEDEDDCPLRNAIRAIMRRDGISEMYLIED